MSNIYGYCRVSSVSQNEDRQLISMSHFSEADTDPGHPKLIIFKRHPKLCLLLFPRQYSIIIDSYE